jgi:hypothetical protein
MQVCNKPYVPAYVMIKYIGNVIIPMYVPMYLGTMYVMDTWVMLISPIAYVLLLWS